MRRTALILSVIPALAFSCASAAGPQNMFEWIAVAPVVIGGTYQGGEGKYAVIEVERVLRGPAVDERTVLVHVRRANRSRNYEADPKALKLEEGRSYVLLLSRFGTRKSDGRTIYGLVRGIRGARELPVESRVAFLDSLERFVTIQDQLDERHTWREMTRMLEETNPMLVETALEQYVKFRRGRPELLAAIRPLLDHPRDRIRELTARLIGQIVSVPRKDALPDGEIVRDEIVARARRDGVVSVRIAATEALNEFDGEVVREILERIADDDPDQNVRYTAERLLLDRPQNGA